MSQENEPVEQVSTDSATPAPADSYPTPEAIQQAVEASRQANQSSAAPAPVPAPEPTEAQTPAPVSEQEKPEETTPAPAAFDEGAWLSEKFAGRYKTADEVAAALAEREKLEANQLTDDHRASLALLADPAARREYLQLADADYTSMSEVEVLRHNFLRKNSTLNPEEAELRFERWVSQEFPGVVDGLDPDHPDFEETPEYTKAKKLMGFQAERDRQELTEYRDQKTQELLKGALPATSADAPPVVDEAAQAAQRAAEQAEMDAHIAEVDTLLNAGLDLTVDLPDGSKAVIGADGSPEELAAIKEAMYTPMKAITQFIYPDGKTKNTENLALLASFLTKGQKLFQDAVQVGRDSVAPHIPLDTLTNAPSTTAAPAESVSFEEALRRTRAANGIR